MRRFSKSAFLGMNEKTLAAGDTVVRDIPGSYGVSIIPAARVASVALIATLVALTGPALADQQYTVSGVDAFTVGGQPAAKISYSGAERLHVVQRPTGVRFEAEVHYTRSDDVPPASARGRFVQVLDSGGTFEDRIDDDPDFLTILNQPFAVWLVPQAGVSTAGLTDDPYYAKVLRDPHSYFTKKLRKYVEKAGCVKRGIEMLIDCHQNHLAFTPLTHLEETPFAHPLEVQLVGSFAF